MSGNGRLALAFNALFVVFMTAPLIVVILVSFTPTGYLQFPPSGLSLRWFWAIKQNQDFITAFWTSLYLGLTAASASTLLAIPAALALGRYRFPGREAIVGLFMSPLTVPTIVLGIAFLRFLSRVGLSSTFTGLALCHTVIITPYALRLVLSSVTGLDQATERAANSLGASAWTTFRRITLPTIMPGVVGGWILAFITSFDELTVTVFIAAPSTTTLPVRLFTHITQTTDPLVASVSTMIILFTVCLLLLIERVYGLDRLLLGSGK